MASEEEDEAYEENEESEEEGEDEEERRRRYLAAPMGECSDPEYWMSVNHDAHNDGSASNESGSSDSFADALQAALNAENAEIMRMMITRDEGTQVTETEREQRRKARIISQMRSIRKALRTMERDCYLGKFAYASDFGAFRVDGARSALAYDFRG